MSLAEQSEQWFPTSVQVTVFQARNLRAKGKNGTNDAYAIMQVAKDKFSTSVAEKSVAPVWKEEATFELPLFHAREPERRCTLYVIVMHRALVGLDKLLGQAVINLQELHGNKSRNKTEWFKLLDKNGKPDKDRGEVLLDIQFMRNNMTASMFDLSIKDKPRSRVGKLKDKIRGKKKDGFSDSASAIVPSVTQVMTDSDEEGSSQSGSPGTKKKSKLKLLFGSKSNLQRNISQSMSTLGTLPEKNSSLSGSRSSGLNVESPEAKNKFKFLTHKRTSSSDSKTSLGPFSLLGRSKQVTTEQSNICINGSHVYVEEPELKGSTLSLASSTQGSLEDVRRIPERNPSDASVDSLKGLSLPSYRAESRRKALLEKDLRQVEEGQNVEVEKLKEEHVRLEQTKQEEEERQKLEEQKKKQEEERMQEEAKRAEERKQQEELKRREELKQQEELSMTGRLTSLLGIGRRKDEQPAVSQEEKHDSKEFAEASPAFSSTNPFEEIPLSPDSQNPFYENPQKGITSPQTPSSGFPTRTAKVSAVKPRPHPVKPMSSMESHLSTGPLLGRDSKLVETHELNPGKTKVTSTSGSGPYSQLTQEELVMLVVKQQAELTKKDNKILELEEYIDNLLVRVIEEKPSILQSLSPSKKAF
ncbi:rab11 family-interacting protein 1 isoform X2 [Scleropages formosus]|uniref:Rab11 family-interacting protein 1-like n=1 Tax=Scleropages formosus TaxID=113540 RepID=A0A8C9RHW7_SCLFO|nr:rab11 family-interacting protein 1-like isoform X2 [Scleropages formosus]